MHPHAFLTSFAHGQNYKLNLAPRTLCSQVWDKQHRFCTVLTWSHHVQVWVLQVYSAEVGESTFAISSAHAYGMNRFIWRTGQQAGPQKPGHYSLRYHGRGWPLEISLTLSVKMPLVLQLRIVKCYHSCICNRDTCPYRLDRNRYVIFQSAETGDPVRLEQKSGFW